MKDVTIQKLENFIDDSDYMELIEKIINSLEKCKLEDFILNISKRWEQNETTEEYRKQLCEMIYPILEENVYDSPIRTIDVKFLRHLKSNDEINEGAFNWHSDNHPPHIINIIVYLTDVGENDGGMEYAEVDGSIIKREFSSPAGGKILTQEIEQLKNTSDVKVHKMTGQKGTVFIFDNCIFHRASVPIDKDRDALLLQVEPSTERVI